MLLRKYVLCNEAFVGPGILEDRALGDAEVWPVLDPTRACNSNRCLEPAVAEVRTIASDRLKWLVLAHQCLEREGFPDGNTYAI